MLEMTTRKTGKIKEAEVRVFQTRYGLKVDGKFGNQCMGQVVVVENLLTDFMNKAPVFPTIAATFLGGGFVGFIFALIVMV